MQKYSEMSREQLLELKKELDQQFADIKAQGLSLDMSRGKPGADQLDLSMGMMDVLADGADLKCETRSGLPQLRRAGRNTGSKAPSWSDLRS